MLRVNENSTHFESMDGKPFFYLADTSWASFGNVPIDAWEPYLRYRKAQNFNALQISVLPIIHDRSVGPGLIEPFAESSDGGYDLSQRNDAYFDKAEEMVRLAVEYGFVPVLGLLWLCYAIERDEPNPYRMTLDEVRAYTSYVVERFAAYDPVYFVAGDTQQREEEIGHYLACLETARSISPDSLYTHHIAGRRVLDERLRDDIDFYMYQSGHGADSQSAGRDLAKQFLALPRKPILNAEPCYEGHGRMRSEATDSNRFTAFDVRRATWQSLLAGAAVGITYGGQGVWSGHMSGMRLLAEKRKYEAYDWEWSYNLDGAWDVGYVKWVWENFDLFGVSPSSIVANAIRPDDPEVVSATDPGMTRVVAYAPYTTSLRVDLDLSDYTCSVINPADRRVWNPTVSFGAVSTVQCPQFNHDMLFLAIKR